MSKKNSKKKPPGDKKIPQKNPFKSFEDFFKKKLQKKTKKISTKFSEVDQGLAGMSPLVDG